jgi:hypothetical protein
VLEEVEPSETHNSKGNQLLSSDALAVREPSEYKSDNKPSSGGKNSKTAPAAPVQAKGKPVEIDAPPAYSDTEDEAPRRGGGAGLKNQPKGNTAGHVNADAPEFEVKGANHPFNQGLQAKAEDQSGKNKFLKMIPGNTHE